MLNHYEGREISIYSLASTKQDIFTQKLKILEFFDKYGAEATRDAFGVSRNTVYERTSSANARVFLEKLLKVAPFLHLPPRPSKQRAYRGVQQDSPRTVPRMEICL